MTGSSELFANGGVTNSGTISASGGSMAANIVTNSGIVNVDAGATLQVSQMQNSGVGER